MKKLKNIFLIGLCLVITFCFAGCAEMIEMSKQTKTAINDFFEYIRQEDYHSASMIFHKSIYSDASILEERVDLWETELGIDTSLPFKITATRETSYSVHSTHTDGPHFEGIYYVSFGHKEVRLKVISSQQERFFIMTMIMTEI